MERYNTEVDLRAKPMPMVKLVSRSNARSKKSRNQTQNTINNSNNQVKRKFSVP